jgi:hypothetical protein
LTSDAVQIRPGSAATLEGWGGKPINAVVRLIEPSAFTRISALGVEEQRVNAIIARLRALELGRRNDVHAEVLKGLSPGERVIVHPHDQSHGWGIGRGALTAPRARRQLDLPPAMRRGCPTPLHWHEPCNSPRHGLLFRNCS